MEPGFKDILGWCNDEEISKIIQNEKIYYSNKVYKINDFSITQERSLLITNKCIYNILSKKVKRQIKIEDIHGITFSSFSKEFIIHANQGYDIHFVSPDKILIIYIISKLYEELIKEPIILCEIRKKSLSEYVTTKTDKKKDCAYSRLDENYKIDTRTFVFNNKTIEIKNRSSSDLTIFSNDSKIKVVSLEDFQEGQANK